MHLRTVIGSLIFSIAILLGTASTSAHITSVSTPRLPLPNTLVAVIEESTAKAGCTLSVDGVPQPCPPGSVVWVDIMPYREAKAKQSSRYIVLTGNAAKDEVVISNVASEVSVQAYTAYKEWYNSAHVA